MSPDNATFHLSLLKLAVIFQLLVSRIILESGLCALPSNNTLWDSVKLNPTDIDDSETCWHGSEYSNCDRTTPIRSAGCKWWHFHSIERKSDLDRKFKEILNNEQPPSKAQLFVIDVGIEMEKLLGLRT